MSTTFPGDLHGGGRAHFLAPVTHVFFILFLKSWGSLYSSILWFPWGVWIGAGALGLFVKGFSGLSSIFLFSERRVKRRKEKGRGVRTGLYYEILIWMMGGNCYGAMGWWKAIYGIWMQGEVGGGFIHVHFHIKKIQLWLCIQ